MSISRRTFVVTTAAGVASLTRAPAVFARRDHDLVIRGGWIYDGNGRPGTLGDIAISGDRIVAIAPRIAERGREEIDATGLAVAPGFIDIHSHADGGLRSDPRAESCIRQGVTTVVVGADGGSRDNIGEYLTQVDSQRPSVNVASMIGLGNVRAQVIGASARKATASEIEEMTELVDAALAGGACGASSGLEYTPGGFAERDELAQVCRPLASRGLVYATHMRNEDDNVLDSIDEAIAIARGAGSALHISHLKMQGPRNWSKLDQAFAKIEAAEAAGMSVTFDRYPYVAYSTGLTSLFPIWSREGGASGLVRNVDNPSLSQRIRDEVAAKIELIGGWDNVQVASVSREQDRAVEGKRIGQFAASLGVDPYDYTVELLRRNGNVGMVGFAMSEDNLDRIFAHRLAMVCSDGGAFAIDGPTRRGSPHPRGIGTFARIIGRYVRERQALSLEDAVRKMTSAPADRCKLPGRGRLVQDAFADVVVFDPRTYSDRATFEDPFQYAVGVRAVVVNGKLALDADVRHEEGNGRGLRPAT
jgi:N-acyl-D-amino-acid deacylase